MFSPSLVPLTISYLQLPSSAFVRQRYQSYQSLPDYITRDAGLRQALAGQQFSSWYELCPRANAGSALTPGERLAAEAALARIKGRLAEAQRTAAAMELHFSIADPWSRQLFLALARRYGLRPYRYPRQGRTTVMLHAPKSFLREVLWPEFEALNEALVGYLAEVTARIIRDEVHGETGDAEERAEPRRLG